MQKTILVLHQVNLDKTKIRNWLNENLTLWFFSQTRKIGFNVHIYFPPINTEFDEMIIITSDLLDKSKIIQKPFKSFIYKYEHK